MLNALFAATVLWSLSALAGVHPVRVLPVDAPANVILQEVLYPFPVQARAVEYSAAARSAPETLAAVAERAFVRWLQEEDIYLRDHAVQMSNRVFSAAELRRVLSVEISPTLLEVVHELGLDFATSRMITAAAIHEGEAGNSLVQSVLVLDLASGQGIEILLIPEQILVSP